MYVCHVISANCRRVAGDGIFGDRVHYVFIAVAFCKSAKAPCPSVSSGDDLACNFFSVCMKPDRDAVRTDTVLIVIVDPGLKTFNVNCLT